MSGRINLGGTRVKKGTYAGGLRARVISSSAQSHVVRRACKSFLPSLHLMPLLSSSSKTVSIRISSSLDE